MTLLVSGDRLLTLRTMIWWFATVQNADGSIPASPLLNHSRVLVDYNAYWIEALYDYTLYTGDMTLVRKVFPNLVRLVDGLYPAHTSANGMLQNWLPGEDYAYISRGGTTVAYYNAQYVRALGMAVALATWEGDRAHARSVAGASGDAWRPSSPRRSGTPPRARSPTLPAT